MGRFGSHDRTKDQRLARARISPVFRRREPPSNEASASRSASIASASSRDSVSTTPARIHMSPDAQRRASDSDRARERARMQKFGALVSSSINRLALEQESADVTYTSLSSLRKTRESWEGLHNRPLRSPHLGSPSVGLPAAASDRTGLRGPNAVEVERIERWLKDVSAALERENETIKDVPAQQVVHRDSVRENAGSPVPLQHNDALQAAAARLEESRVELLAQYERVQVRGNARDQTTVWRQQATPSLAL